MLQSSIVSRKGEMIISHMGSSKPSIKQLDFLRGLMENGRLIPAIERTYPLEETADAMRYVEEEHAKAKIVITMDHK